MTGRDVLVTGAARGIGLEVVRQLADRGDRVVLTARDAEAGAAAASDLQAEDLEVRFEPLDVADPASIERLAGALDRLDVLVNNAAAYVDWSETASTADLAAAREVLEVNLFGPWAVTQALLPLLRAGDEPRIVNVTSGAGSHGDEQFGLTSNAGAAATYGISKAAANALTTKLATELAGTGVLVNAVCPGLTATYPGAEDMGARPVAEGAAGVVWAATLPAGGPTGGFFRDGEPLPW